MPVLSGYHELRLKVVLLAKHPDLKMAHPIVEVQVQVPVLWQGRPVAAVLLKSHGEISERRPPA